MNAALQIVGVMTVAATALASARVTMAPVLHAQAAQRTAAPNVRLPDESAGIDGIVAALISVYDQFDVVALGESHARKVESDLRVALARHPDFAKKVRTIVVEFASTTEQATLDRYIRGEDVPRAQFERVWKRTSQYGVITLVGPGGPRSIFKGSTLTLGQMADAVFYYVGGR
jgi:hypothetical protein